ncbi:unnamed protein product [Effrenium voratum]|nr:unnamed protein product [Effrenium voratum]
MFTKDGDEEVSVYFIESEGRTGWWFGQYAGHGSVYAFNPSDASEPPMAGWHVPWTSSGESHLHFAQAEGMPTFEKGNVTYHDIHDEAEHWEPHVPPPLHPEHLASPCRNQTVAPNGGWVVYNGSEQQLMGLPVECRSFPVDALVPEACCHLGLANIFDQGFKELYQQQGSCSRVVGGGLFHEAFTVKLRCNSDNTITYGHDCPLDCECGSEKTYPQGCYRGVDRIPETTWFFMVGGCECTGAKMPKVWLYYYNDDAADSAGWWIGSGADSLSADCEGLHIATSRQVVLELLQSVCLDLVQIREDAPPLEGWKAPWWAEVDKSMRVAPVVQEVHPYVVKDEEHEPEHTHDEHEDAMKTEEVMPPEDEDHEHYDHESHGHWQPIMDAISKASEGSNNMVMKTLEEMAEHMKEMEETVDNMQDKLHPGHVHEHDMYEPMASTPPPFEEAAHNISEWPDKTAKPLVVGGCAQSACSKLTGTYLPAGFYLGRPMYHKAGVDGEEVLIYYHHDGEHKGMDGWWFGTDSADFASTENLAFHAGEGSVPPKSGWHLPWNGSVDPDLEIIEGDEVIPIAPQEPMHHNETLPPPMEVPIEIPDEHEMPTDRTLPIVATPEPEHAAPILHKDLNPDELKQILREEGDMISAAVGKLNGGKELADLVFGTDAALIPKEPPSEEMLEKLAKDPELAKKALNKTVMILEKAMEKLNSGEAFADEVFGTNASAWAETTQEIINATMAPIEHHDFEKPDKPDKPDKLDKPDKPEFKPFNGSNQTMETEPPVASSTPVPAGAPPIPNSQAAPLVDTVDKVAAAANEAAEKARQWQDAEIAENRAQQAAEEAKRHVEKLTVEAAKEEAEKAIEHAADEEAKEAKVEATKEAKEAEAETKAKEAEVAEKQQKLEAMKGEVPQAARDAAAKAVQEAEKEEHAKAEKVKEAKFAKEDLGPGTPPDVAEAAEEAVTRATLEDKVAQDKVDETTATLRAMNITVTPENRAAAEKELAAAQEAARQAAMKAANLQKKAGEIKLVKHDEAEDNALFPDSEPKEAPGGAIVMGSEPKTDEEKDLEDKLAVLQSKLAGLERVQMKEVLEKKLDKLPNASLTQEDGQRTIRALSASSEAATLAQRAGEEPETLVAAGQKPKEQEGENKEGEKEGEKKKDSAKAEKKEKGSWNRVTAFVMCGMLVVVLGSLATHLLLKKHKSKQAQPEEQKPLMEESESPAAEAAEAQGSAEEGAAASSPEPASTPEANPTEAVPAS